MFARRKAKTRIRQRDWLKLAGEKIRREQVGSVPTFFVCSREQIRLVENGLKFTASVKFAAFLAVYVPIYEPFFSHVVFCKFVFALFADGNIRLDTKLP